jgi:hypothetical protein
MSAKMGSRRFIKQCSILCSILLLIAIAGPATAGVGIFGSYASVGGTWYGGTQPGTPLSALDGAGFGTFNVGDNLLLSGAELLTYKNSGSDVWQSHIFYNVHETSSSSGTFADVNVNWNSNNPFNDAAGNFFNSSGDQKWSNITSTPDLLSGLGAGDYQLEIYFMIDTNEGTIYDSNSNENYVSTFSVTSPAPGVPEPAACLLALFGMLSLGMLYRRRR